MKVILVDFLLLFLLKFLMIIGYPVLAGNDESFRATPSTSSGQYRYSVSGEPVLTTVLVFWIFFYFMSICLSVSLSVHLFTISSI